MTQYLRTETSSLLIEPECGSIRSWQVRHGGRFCDLLRPVEPKVVDAREALVMGCFPLVPYSGPVVGGRFSFLGKNYRLPRTHHRQTVPIHGDGWVSPWQTSCQGQATLELALEHTGVTGYPFRYSVHQRLRLSPNELEVELAVTNAGQEPMPVGIGFHPFFPKDNDTTVKTLNPLVWSQPDSGGSIDPQPTPAELDFTAGRKLEGIVLDHCFSGWSRHAILTWPSRGYSLVLEADETLDKIVVFAPENEGYFCVEPVSNVDDGFNKMALGVSGHGVQCVAPGGSISGRMRLSFVDHAAIPQISEYVRCQRV
ncbi:aldose 1-epimerase [Ensifer adhaerens]|uniref:aldose 1-epimerase n=1 Tax=Ensifer adhaerens TaxID=106592 RepID=UPI000CF1A4C3|nr:aldose 1-epimerase [Ensifer adhaerens]